MTDSEINKRNRNLLMEKSYSNFLNQCQAFPKLLVIGGKLKANKLTNLRSQFVDDPPKVYDWYFVEYQNKLYPGEIKEVDDVTEEYKMETMEATGK